MSSIGIHPPQPGAPCRYREVAKKKAPHSRLGFFFCSGKRHPGVQRVILASRVLCLNRVTQSSLLNSIISFDWEDLLVHRNKRIIQSKATTWHDSVPDVLHLQCRPVSTPTARDSTVFATGNNLTHVGSVFCPSAESLGRWHIRASPLALGRNNQTLRTGLTSDAISKYYTQCDMPCAAWRSLFPRGRETARRTRRRTEQAEFLVAVSWDNICSKTQMYQNRRELASGQQTGLAMASEASRTSS